MGNKALRVMMGLILSVLVLISCTKGPALTQSPQLGVSPTPVSKALENPSYMIFYGEWEITEVVFVQGELLGGEPVTKEHITQIGKKFTLLQDKAVFSNVIVENPFYDNVILPVNNPLDQSYTGLARYSYIGIVGPLTAYVEVLTQEKNYILDTPGSGFYIIDDQTLILHHEQGHTVYYKAKRISYPLGQTRAQHV